MYNPGFSADAFQIIINFLPIFGAGYLLLGLISDRNRDIQGGFFFSLLMIASSVYTFGYYFEVHSSDVDTAFMYLSIEYIGLAFLGTLWVLFIMEYTGRFMKYRRYIATFMVLFSLITLFVVNSNPAHELYYQNLGLVKLEHLSLVTFDRGPWYWIFVSYTNICFLIGTILLLYTWYTSNEAVRKRFFLLFIGSLFPWISLIINQVSHNNLKIDFGPFGILAAALIFIYNIYAYKLFELLPAAKKTVFESMQDGVVILNRENLVTECNQAAERLLGKHLTQKGADAASLFNQETLQKILNSHQNDEDITIPYKQNGSEIVLSIRASQISDHMGENNGTLLILRDVTTQIADEEEIRNLLAEKEILLREVHHRIKNNMNTIAGFLTLQARNMADQGAIIALQEAKNKISGMMMIYDKLMHTNDFTNISSADYLNQLIDYITSSYDNESKIHIKRQIDDEILDSKIMFQLGIILNELLTNSYKYAFPNRNDGLIDICFRVESHTLTLIYRDNGNVLPEEVMEKTKPGLGLSLISLLVRQLKGTLEINRREGTEFKIVIRET
ncbi:histidine kinase N-terminal 7TM domain-containing protein [Fidelibacter multiformis]|uniref:histidine kinase N-terminal 7TM domain-containing protein n=1 Tax=Fidelibacter multiformis TaxID=3377529 RepID=UPI0037DDABC0